MNVAEFLTSTAAAHPDHPALRLEEEVISYRELEELSARVAALLAARGLVAGDRVAVMLGNVPEFAAVYYGVLRMGGTVVPMNPLLKAREVGYSLGDSGAKLIFTGEAAAAAEVAAGAGAVPQFVLGPGALAALTEDHAPAAGVALRDPADTAVILYTSGTTGQPKGAELTHGNLVRNVDVTLDDLLHLGPEDVVFGGLPLFHSFGQTCTLNAAVAAGATLLLLPRFHPATALRLLQTYHGTMFAGVPTMYVALLTVPDPPALPDLRVCVSGGAALPVEVLQAFEKAFAAVVLEGYGLSETSPVAAFNRPDRLRKPGSIGYPVTGVEMRVLDAEGVEVPVDEASEIAIRGHNVMKGYWGKPEQTSAVLSQDGWFRTGDIGRVDADGCYFIVDRKKDLIIRGGFNVYPREIEEVLYEHPAVAEAAVVGLPHPTHGEEIGAAVALKSGARTTPEELREHVKSQVAAYKYPRVVWLVDQLPKGPTGKIMKREIVPPSAVYPSTAGRDGDRVIAAETE